MGFSWLSKFDSYFGDNIYGGRIMPPLVKHHFSVIRRRGCNDIIVMLHSCPCEEDLLLLQQLASYRQWAKPKIGWQGIRVNLVRLNIAWTYKLFQIVKAKLRSGLTLCRKECAWVWVATRLTMNVLWWYLLTLIHMFSFQPIWGIKK